MRRQRAIWLMTLILTLLAATVPPWHAVDANQSGEARAGGSDQIRSVGTPTSTPTRLADHKSGAPAPASDDGSDPAREPATSTIGGYQPRAADGRSDTCATAGTLLLNTPLDGSTVGATNDYQLSGAAVFTGIGQTASTAPGRDVVYSFTAPSTGAYSFRVRNYLTGQNLVLYVASACPTGTPPLIVNALKAANRNASGVGESVDNVVLTGGQTIFVFVDNHVAGNAGSVFTLEAEQITREFEPNGTTATANA